MICVSYGARPPPGLCPGHAGGLTAPPDPQLHRVKACRHCISCPPHHDAQQRTAGSACTWKGDLNTRGHVNSAIKRHEYVNQRFYGGGGGGAIDCKLVNNKCLLNSFSLATGFSSAISISLVA